MANLSLRMLSVFLFAAFLLNTSNYLFIRVYNPPHKSNLNYNYPKTASGLEIMRSPSTTDDYWSIEVHSFNKAKTTSTSYQRKNHSETNNTFSAYYLVPGKTKTTLEENYCPELPSGLGPVPEDGTLTLKNGYNYNPKFSDVEPGGMYQPTSCKSQHSVAILIAYRGCRSNILKLLNALHPFLMKQQLDYQIFVIEQSNSTQPYNRGKLLNVGFMEATRFRKTAWRCIIIHEPNITPLDSRNLYRCSWYPKQLVTRVIRPIKPPYRPLLGGAIAMTPEQLLKINGFSNLYWGNDADYLDLYHRINSTNYLIENSIPLIGRYRMIMKGLGLWHRSEYSATPSPLYLVDGLTSLSYTVDVIDFRPLYTYLQVNIDDVVKSNSNTKMTYDRVLKPSTDNSKQ